MASSDVNGGRSTFIKAASFYFKSSDLLGNWNNMCLGLHPFYSFLGSQHPETLPKPKPPAAKCGAHPPKTSGGRGARSWRRSCAGPTPRRGPTPGPPGAIDLDLALARGRSRARRARRVRARNLPAVLGAWGDVGASISVFVEPPGCRAGTC